VYWFETNCWPSDSAALSSTKAVVGRSKPWTTYQSSRVSIVKDVWRAARYTSKMRLLAEWTIRHGDVDRRIQLLQGDLSQLPPEHAVDILVVSAFPNDYLPTPSSLIGALYRTGISVEGLSRSKQMDMRQEFSCWLSQPVFGTAAFRQILCVESGWRGTPPEITDDLFRALAPLFATAFPGGSLAMPIIGAGDQGWPPDQMLESLMRAALSWFKRGLSISAMKIVIFSERIAIRATQTFLDVRTQIDAEADEQGHRQQVVPPANDKIANGYDLFVSYCHEDSDAAHAVVEFVRQAVPSARIFYDQKTVVPGQSWLMDIAESLDSARRVTALFTPHYWSSRYCKDEFAAALTRQHDTGSAVLFPIYFRSANIPYLFRNLQYADCREADSAKLAEACSVLCKTLG
jgi:hypothetical protein